MTSRLVEGEVPLYGVHTDHQAELTRILSIGMNRSVEKGEVPFYEVHTRGGQNDDRLPYTST